MSAKSKQGGPENKPKQDKSYDQIFKDKDEDETSESLDSDSEIDIPPRILSRVYFDESALLSDSDEELPDNLPPLLPLKRSDAAPITLLEAASVDEFLINTLRQ